MMTILTFFRSPPSCIKRREILRDYVAMWRKDFDDPSTPKMILPRIKFFTAETPTTKMEAKKQDDLVLLKSDRYDPKFDDVPCDQIIFSENGNDSAKYDEGKGSSFFYYQMIIILDEQEEHPKRNVQRLDRVRCK